MKAKIAFLFPGQGAQEVGMARDLFRDDEYFRSLVDYGSELAGDDLKRICMRGPEKVLMKSRFVQPLLASVSLGYLRRITEKGIRAEVVMGHSLGEITALGAAGVVSDKDTIAIATKRGILMDEAAVECEGGMMAVLFLPLKEVNELLAQINAPKKLVLANDNAPNQVVVSGEKAYLDALANKIHEKGGKTRPLIVAGPWHSPYLHPARRVFEEWAEPMAFQVPHTPILLNATAKPEMHPTTIKHLVTWQLTSPVFFRESMQTLLAMGIDTLLEIGPGRVLSGLARVNGLKRSASVYNISDLRGVERAVQELAG
jgi:[acyl-carrier-protein] S-malonyltransferase